MVFGLGKRDFGNKISSLITGIFTRNFDRALLILLEKYLCYSRSYEFQDCWSPQGSATIGSFFVFSALKPLILDTSSSATKTFSKMSTWYKCTSQNSRVELGFPFRTILKNSCMSAICRIFVGFVCFGKILVS